MAEPVPQNPYEQFQAQQPNPYELFEKERNAPGLIEGGYHAYQDFLEPVLQAFGHGFMQSWEPETLGISKEDAGKLADAGFFAPKGTTRYTDTGWRAPLYAFNELLADTVVRTGQTLLRGSQGIMGGLQAAGEPLVNFNAIMEPFMGSPHMLAAPKPWVKPSPIKPVEQPSPLAPISRAEAAKTGLPQVDAVLDDPVLRHVIDNPVIDRTHAVPNSWGGSLPLENPTTYLDHEFPKTLTVDGVTFDPAEPAVVHENVEAFAIQKLVAGGMAPDAALRTAYWGWGNPAEHAWYSAHGMDPEHVEAALRPILDRIATRKGGDVPDDLFRGTYPNGDPQKAAAGDVPKPSAEETARARAIMDGPAAGPKGFYAYHGSPHDFDQFDIGKIGAGEGGQAYGHGLYFAEHPGVAKDYARRLANRTGGGMGFVGRLPPEEPGNFYKVRINADKEHFLDFDKPLSEQSAHVNEALKQSGLLSELESLGGGMERHSVTDLLNSLRRGFKDDSPVRKEAEVSTLLRDAGIPGIKYLDQGSRRGGEGTRNFVVFDDKLIEVLEQNGIAKASDLGVIGPEKPPVTEGTPADAARNAVPPKGPPGSPPGSGDGAGGPGEPKPNPWRERFEHFVGKIKSDEDAKQLIRDAADENDEFPQARQGDIPLKQVEDLAAAAGVDPATVDPTGVGRMLRNDNQVRNAMQAMLAATEQVKAAARDVRADPSPENLIKLQEVMLRRDAWVEQVVGHRAEWGRTGNVFQEFLEHVKDEQTLNDFLKDKDRSAKGLEKIADALDALDRGQAARLLSDANKPTFWDKFLWYWVNALISGPVTHAKYIVANETFAAYESAVVTPIAGVVGGARRAVTGSIEGVRAGETVARLWGLVAGTPDAIMAAAKAGRTGLQTPLPGEVAQNIIPKFNTNIAFQQRPISGPLGTVIGLPSRGASAIHSFFNFLGYRASLEAQTYRMARQEGLSPVADDFWQRRQALADAPTKEMMDGAIEEGYRLTYISELGETGKALTALLNSYKPLRLIMPFTHIPLNILKRGIEGTPAAFLDGETRGDLFGRNGAVKQDMAVARLVAGTAVGTWVLNSFFNDRMTGYGPMDPTERAQWLATDHQPYSIRIGNYWYSFNRFGSLGTMLGLYANLAEASPHLQADSEELTKAMTMVVHATGRLLEDEVGMQGLAGLIEAIDDPERKGTRFVSNFAGSLLPFSSALRQTASAMDPYMRETKSVVDGLRYYIPRAREGLMLKRNWLGEPIANAGYGGDLPVPGLSSVIQHRAAGADPLATEMQTLGLKPAPPVDRVGGVKLPPSLYDRYQVTAGAMTRTMLEHFVQQPGWEALPLFMREQMFRNGIRAAREAAAATMQARYPAIIQQGIDQRERRITGQTPQEQKPRPMAEPAP